MQLVKAATEKLRKFTSLEYILKKLIEFDKVKIILFNEKELEMLTHIQNPSLVERKTENNYIQSLWQKVEDLEDIKIKKKILPQRESNNDDGNFTKKMKSLI
jgi:hypothetical protein